MANNAAFKANGKRIQNRKQDKIKRSNKKKAKVEFHLNISINKFDQEGSNSNP
jgi:hypothetical protein